MLYLTVPGVALARLTGFGLVPGYVLSVFAVIALSLSLRAAVHPPGERRYHHAPVSGPAVLPAAISGSART